MLYLGSSHLVSMEMVQPPFHFRYRGRWQIKEHRRILASDLPRGTLDVYGRCTARETLNRYEAITSSTASWREFYPYTYSHAILLLGEITWLNSMRNTKPTQVLPGGISSHPSTTPAASAP